MRHDFKNWNDAGVAEWYAQYGRATQAGGYPGLRKLRLAAERELAARGISRDFTSLLGVIHPHLSAAELAAWPPPAGPATRRGWWRF